MNVWITRTRKRVPCKYCGRYIEAGEYQVVCRYYMKLRSGKSWLKQMSFHAQEPNCWLDRAIAELETRPIVETRGRKANVISDTDREAREKILRRRASVTQRLDQEMADAKRPDKLIHLIELLDRLVVEIEPYGGVPKSWL